MQHRLLTLRRLLPFGVCWVLLAGCDRDPAETVQTNPTRPAQILVVKHDNPAAKLRFPGRIRASERAELSFNVSGYLAQFNPREGSALKAGEVVAKLEDRVFRARVNAAQAEFNRAKTDLGRYRRLWDTERAVARSEVDDRISKLEVARTNLAAAEQDLEDATLRAPFDGVITRRRVQAFSSVQAKQPIADLQSLDKLEVVINVPERTFRTERPRQHAIAVFDAMEDRPIALTLKSYTTETDPQTQTYEVVLTVDKIPPGLSLLPGMAVTVMPFLSDIDSNSSSIWIPLGAVVCGASKTPYVWVVDDQGIIDSRVIETGEIRGAQVQVLKGLAADERIVTAGVHSLTAGMKVRPLAGD